MWFVTLHQSRTTGRSQQPKRRRGTDLVLVLRAARVVLLQRGEGPALGARLGAGVQLAQLHEVAILDQVLAGQAGHHRALLQVAVALWEGAADAGAGATHLQHGQTDKKKWENRPAEIHFTP